LQLVEQPRVLDCDDRLIGKGLEQLDLLVRKRSCLWPPDGKRTDRCTLKKQRRYEQGTYA